ncbi:MAG: thermonuclease family protein [Candidatus Omnitrophota bacterium]
MTPEPFAVDAKKYNAELVEGKTVRLEFDIEKEDQYKRWLAYVYVDDIMVNRELLKKGYAYVYTFPPNIRYLASFVKAQEKALSEKAGIWAGIKEISSKDMAGYVGKYVIARGKVSETYFSDNKVVLVLSGSNDVSIPLIIFKKNCQLFVDKGFEPLTFYKNKKIEIFGKVEERDGIRILIDNPGQVNVLKR